jgi:redox-sensitive bicupin YhaK (pirin superfamily)
LSIRPVKRLIKSKPTLEGAGVHLRRAFGFGNTSDFDPFLLLDDFRNDVPEDYLAGFPWHPHRGIETITYVLAGTVEHGDSLGNRGAISPGDVQWMTAGSGIIHQEMPKGDQAGRMHGFQLWGNLPSSLKMTPPRYQEVKAADIPEITDDDGTHVKIVAGNFWGKNGPVDGVAAEPVYLDVSATRSPTYSPARENSATHPRRCRCRPKASAGWRRFLPLKPTTVLWWCSTEAMKWKCKPVRKESVSCWFPENRWPSRWPGTVPSS